MSGRWIKRDPDPQHRCDPPRQRFGEVWGPAGLPGSVWECGCGQRWEVAASLFYEMARACGTTPVRGGLLGPAWRPQERTS